MNQPSLRPISSIKQEELDVFDCTPTDCDNQQQRTKYQEINSFLKNDAKNFDQQNLLKTLVWAIDTEIIGFVSTAASTTELKRKYRQQEKIPAVVQFFPSIDIVYFAIDAKYQHQNHGLRMMKSILGNIFNHIVPYTAVTLVTVQALKMAQGFYKKFGFAFHDSKNHDGMQANMALTIPEIELILSISEPR